MPKLLAIDAGFTAGFAVVEPGQPPITGSRSIPGSNIELGRACHHFGHMVRDLIDEHHPDGLVLCRPFISAFAFKTKNGLDRVTPNINVSMVLDGFYGMAAAVAFSRDIQFIPLYEGAVRKAFGVTVPQIKDKEKRRKALKAAVVAKCVELHWLVCDDHAADALLAAAYQLGKMVRGIAHESTPLFAAAA